MISIGISTRELSGEDHVKELFSRTGIIGKENEIAENLATVLLGRVIRRYRKEENPDGSKWEESGAAGKRKAGGYTMAKGGDYAPGGPKTGGWTLFSSGNLFRSIAMKTVGAGEFSIQSDVPYAVNYMNENYTIIGTTGDEFNKLIKAAIERLS